MTAQEARAIMPEVKDPTDEILENIFLKIQDMASRGGNNIDYYYGQGIKDFQQKRLLNKLTELGYNVTNIPDPCILLINWCL